MIVYAKVRAVVLENSMKHLRDHQKNASGGSMQNVQGMINSPMTVSLFVLLIIRAKIWIR